MMDCAESLSYYNESRFLPFQFFMRYKTMPQLEAFLLSYDAPVLTTNACN